MAVSKPAEEMRVWSKPRGYGCTESLAPPATGWGSQALAYRGSGRGFNLGSVLHEGQERGR